MAAPGCCAGQHLVARLNLDPRLQAQGLLMGVDSHRGAGRVRGLSGHQYTASRPGSDL